MSKAFNFGRVFFPGKAQPIPEEIRFQPLGNHNQNTIILARSWNPSDFPEKSGQDRVIEGLKIHDVGKPKYFSIQAEVNRNGQFKKYIYSFRGHRFDARHQDSWIQRLGIGHHDYSVRDITRDTYELMKLPEYADILAQDPLAYARELYILEMCDQIEAELACRVLGDEEQAESRTFMDFTITKQDERTYLIDPWPFQKSSLSLTFTYWSMRPQDVDSQGRLQNCINNKKESDLGKILDTLVKKEWWEEWWKNQSVSPPTSSITISLAPYPSSESTQKWTAEAFYKQLANFEPNPMQVEMFKAIYDPEHATHPAVLLKALTGKGKTEAVVFPALASNYRLFLILPTRSLLDDQKERIEDYLKKLSTIYSQQEFSLVVDTGSQMRRWIYQNGAEVKRHINPRRHLYKGDVILTTIDKFLYRYFAFGAKQKSFIFPLRINDKRTLICFDEAHTYDDISFTNFQNLVRSLYEAGRSLVLMTATMPPELDQYFDYLKVLDFTQSSQPYPKSFEWYKDIPCYEEDADGKKDFTQFQDRFAEIVLQEWQKDNDHRILAVVETVRDAVEIYKKLKQYFGTNEDSSGRFLFLYHGRIAEQLRPGLYKQIKERDNNEQPYIVITTKAIEVGCNLNTKLVISQICPPENLLQRAGRCNRKGNVQNAKVILVGDKIPNFANTLDDIGWQTYQETLRELNSSQQFDTQKISNSIFRRQHIDDYRVVELFSMLHDYVYGADLTCQPAHEKGLIPTRSWEPSVEVRYMLSDTEYHSISAPISQLASGNRQEYKFVYALEKRYDKENTRWYEAPISWGSAYDKDIIIQIKSDLSEFIFDDSLLEYSYDPEVGFVELPKIFSAKWIDGAKVKLKYEAKKWDGSKQIAIISYTHSITDE